MVMQPPRPRLEPGRTWPFAGRARRALSDGEYVFKMAREPETASRFCLLPLVDRYDRVMSLVWRAYWNGCSVLTERLPSVFHLGATLSRHHVDRAAAGSRRGANAVLGRSTNRTLTRRFLHRLAKVTVRVVISHRYGEDTFIAISRSPPGGSIKTGSAAGPIHRHTTTFRIAEELGIWLIPCGTSTAVDPLPLAAIIGWQCAVLSLQGGNTARRLLHLRAIGRGAGQRTPAPAVVIADQAAGHELVLE